MTITVPWTPAQVDALNRYQRHGIFHPFTCARHHGRADSNLVATRNGWICCHCDYTENWAHETMLDEYLLRPAAPARGKVSMVALIFVAMVVGMAATFSLAQQGGFSGLRSEFLDFFGLR